MKIVTKQSGSAHIAIIIVLVVAVVAVLGFVFLQNFMHKKTSSDATNTTHQTENAKNSTSNYTGWQDYNNSIVGYSLKYPAGWTLTEASTDELSAAFASTTFIPVNKTTGVITVSSYKSSLSPEKFINSAGMPTIIESNNTLINHQEAYYIKSGDSTYTNIAYAISHNGVITTISMTEEANSPLINNSQYVGQLTLIASSFNL